MSIGDPILPSVPARPKRDAAWVFVGRDGLRALWSLLIYSPVAHWMWAPGGWGARLRSDEIAAPDRWRRKRYASERNDFRRILDVSGGADSGAGDVAH